MRAEVHRETELAPYSTPPTPADQSLLVPGSVSCPGPPQEEAPDPSPLKTFSPGKPRKLKNAVAAAGTAQGLGWERWGCSCARAGLSTTDSSVTYLSSFGNGWSPKSRSRNRYRGGKGSTSVSRSFIVRRRRPGARLRCRLSLSRVACRHTAAPPHRPHPRRTRSDPCKPLLGLRDPREGGTSTCRGRG